MLFRSATLHGQLAWRWFSVAAELAATAGASDRWSSAGLGNTVLDVRFVFGRVPTQAIGIRATLPSGSRYGARGPVAWWGTVPSATVPTFGFAIAWEGATERWTWHVHVGQETDTWWAFAYFWNTWDLDAIVATVQPFAPGWSVVAEVEALDAPDPVHLRGLARRDLGAGWTVDAGLALPLPSLFTDPSLQLLGQVRGAW